MIGKITTFALAWALFSGAAISCLGNPGNPKIGFTPFQTGGPVSGSPAAAPSGSPIYVTSEDGNLYAINPANGQAVWSQPANIPTGAGSQGGELISSPTVACDGTIYVASSDENLVSINPDGSINWKWSLPGGESPGAVAIGSNNRTVYVTWDDDSHLYAVTNLHSTTPSTAWSLDLANDVFKAQVAFVDSAPVVGTDGTVYLYAIASNFGNDNAFLVAVQDNGNSPSVKWIVNLGFADDKNDFQTSLVLDNNGRIYAPYSVGSPDTTCLQAFKTSDGAPAWSLPFAIPSSPAFPSGAPFHTSPALATNGTIYIGADDGVLYAINSNGTLKWKFDTQTGKPIRSSPAVSSDGTIVFGTGNGIWAVKDNGTTPTQPSWTFALSQEVRSSPLITGSDNAVYVGCADHNVYAVYGSAPLAASAWPLFAGNIQRMAHQGLPSTICCPDTLSVTITPNYPDTIYKGSTGLPYGYTQFTISRKFPGPALTIYFYLGGDGTANGGNNNIFAMNPQDFTPSGCTTIPIPNGFQTTIPSGQTQAIIGVTPVDGNHISSDQWLFLTLISAQSSCVTLDPNASQALVFEVDPSFSN